MLAPVSSEFTDPVRTWNKRFAQQDYVFGTAPNKWLREHAGVWPANSRILSVADGEGRNSVWLAGQGHRVDAFDIAEVGVAKARWLAWRHQVSVNFTVADCDNFDWPQGAYDGVAAIFVQFADPLQRQRLFANIVNSLKPGGTLILQGYTPKQLEYKTGGPPIVSHLYTQKLLRNLLADLDIQILHEYDAEILEGHQGQSALVGLVAKRC